MVAITSPVDATPKNLVKLAPATWREAASIAVRRDGAELVAWALLERNATAHQPLTIRALASGVLRVDYAGIPRALFARGEMFFLGGAHDVKSPSLRYLAPPVTTWPVRRHHSPLVAVAMHVAP